MRVCPRVRPPPVPPGAIFRLTKPLFPIFPRCVVFQLAWPGRRKKIASHFRHRGGGIKKRGAGRARDRSPANTPASGRPAILDRDRRTVDVEFTSPSRSAKHGGGSTRRRKEETVPVRSSPLYYLNLVFTRGTRQSNRLRVLVLIVSFLFIYDTIRHRIDTRIYYIPRARRFAICDFQGGNPF